MTDTKDDIKIISETPTGDGFVDCVWEISTPLYDKLDGKAKKQNLTIEELIVKLLTASVKGNLIENSK